MRAPPAPADSQPSPTPEAAPSPRRGPEIKDDVPQLHLAATVEAADSDDA